MVPRLRLAANGIPLLVSAFYLWRALVLPDAPNAVVSPRAYPIAIGVFTVVISVYVLAEALVARWRSAPPPEEPASDVNTRTAPHVSNEIPSDSRREHAAAVSYVCVLVGVILVGLVSFERLGAAVAIFAFIAGLATVAEPRRWKRNLLVAGVFALTSDYAFRYGLDVYLPTGPW